MSCPMSDYTVTICPRCERPRYATAREAGGAHR